MELGTQFDFSYAPGVTDEQILGFEMAGEIWSQHLADNVTVNIYVEMTDQLPENVIGGALPGMKKDLNINRVHNQMKREDTLSADDITALNELCTDGSAFSIMTNGEELDNTKSLKLTFANAKSLDIISSDRDDLDGYILMSDLTGQSSVQWDYDPLRDELENGDLVDNVLSDNELDFVSVALHEIGHVLGFVSGVDDEGWLNMVTEANETGKEIKSDSMKFLTPLDLFRYSSESAAVELIDLSTGGDAYFSIDGGQTNLANFSTGEYSDLGGDGYQASHWQQSGDNPLGLMDPALKPGQARSISALDMTAMDVMGWDVVDPGELNLQQVYENALDSVDNALVADRTKDVEKMVKQSKTYHGRRGSRGGSWQVGLWQHIKFQTLDIEANFNTFGSGLKVADNYLPGFESDFTADSDLEEATQTDIDTIIEVEETVIRLIENSQAVLAEYATLDLEELGSLLSEELEDILEADEKSLVMSVG